VERASKRCAERSMSIQKGPGNVWLKRDSMGKCREVKGVSAWIEIVWERSIRFRVSLHGWRELVCEAVEGPKEG